MKKETIKTNPEIEKFVNFRKGSISSYYFVLDEETNLRIAKKDNHFEYCTVKQYHATSYVPRYIP